MYLPKHFQVTDADTIERLVSAYPLAYILAQTVDPTAEWSCDPVPLIPDGTMEPGQILLGHVAKANPLWQATGSVTALFTGPSIYITPNAYASKHEHHRVVPTFNYAVVQVTGRLRAIHDQTRKLTIVTQLTERFEREQPAPWSVSDAPTNYIDAMLQAIVGLEIEITSVRAKFKLSQNRHPQDQAGVQQYLRTKSDLTDADRMLKLMQASAHSVNEPKAN